MRACDGFRVPGIEAVERQCFLVVRQVALQPAPGVSPLQVGSLILEMQQRPQLEARIRDREFYAVGSGLLTGIGEVGMNVNVEDTPNLIIAKEIVSSSAGLTVGLLLPCRGALHKGLGNGAPVVDLDVH